MQEDLVAAITASPRYQELTRIRRRFAWTLTVIILLIYLGFILVIAFAPHWFGIPLGAGLTTTVGMPVGVLIIISAFVLTGIYVARANSLFDRYTQEIQEEFS